MSASRQRRPGGSESGGTVDGRRSSADRGSATAPGGRSLAVGIGRRSLAASPGGRSLAVGIGLRVLGFAVAWWALTEGDPRSPWLAALGIAGATAASIALVTPSGDRRLPGPIRSARFAGFFLLRAGAGAVDVARRAVLPGQTINPGFIDHPVRLPPGHGRTLLVAMVNLMPGTLSAELGERRLRIHALDTRGRVGEAVSDLEAHIAGLLGLPLGDGDGNRPLHASQTATRPRSGRQPRNHPTG
jgi:multicomponent Na+:H+ antiporter subunit E